VEVGGGPSHQISDERDFLRLLRLGYDCKCKGKCEGSDFDDSTVLVGVICRRELFRKKYLLAGVLFDEHRVSLQRPTQKDRISIFRPAVGVCSRGAMSSNFSLEDFMVTTLRNQRQRSKEKLYFKVN